MSWYKRFWYMYLSYMIAFNAQQEGLDVCLDALPEHSSSTSLFCVCEKWRLWQDCVYVHAFLSIRITYYLVG